MPDSTIATATILDRLVAGKRELLDLRRAAEPLALLRERALAAPPTRPFAASLQGDDVRLIAEIKKASPTRGMLELNFDPRARARAYLHGGAAAISILTEEREFLGSLDHLTAVGSVLGPRGAPLLRKDFLFDPYHLYEARAAGADAILLIVALLDQAALVDLLALAAELGLGALVEIHDERELERALLADASVIGINNRNLRTFATDLAVTERLAPRLPSDRLCVSESGVADRAHVERLARAGVDAILVGEALMRSGDIAAAMHDLTGVRKIVSSRTLDVGVKGA